MKEVLSQMNQRTKMVENRLSLTEIQAQVMIIKDVLYHFRRKLVVARGLKLREIKTKKLSFSLIIMLKSPQNY
jgi:hypothetical protein